MSLLISAKIEQSIVFQWEKCEPRHNSEIQLLKFI